MHWNPDLPKDVVNHISYFASQAKALRTMVHDKRNNYDIAVMMLAAK